MSDLLNLSGLGLVSGFFIGAFIFNFLNWSRREDLKETFSLSELTDMMAKKMAKEEDERVKSNRADRVRVAVREIVRKEFGE